MESYIVHRSLRARSSARPPGELSALRPDRRGSRAEHSAGRRLPRRGDRRPRAVARRHAAPRQRLDGRSSAASRSKASRPRASPESSTHSIICRSAYRWSTRMIYLDQHESPGRTAQVSPQVEAAGPRLLDAGLQDAGRLDQRRRPADVEPGGCRHRRCQLGARDVRLLHAGHRADGRQIGPR